MMLDFAAVAVGIMSLGQVAPLTHIQTLSDQLRGPARLAVASDDTLLVTDPLNRHIVRFDSNGIFIDTWPVPAGPGGVAVHPDGRIFVSLLNQQKVAIHDAAFSLLGFLGEDNPLVSFVSPTDIDIATDTGRIYIVDPDADTVYAFESDGTLAFRLGSRGSLPAQFLHPVAVSVDKSRSRIIVADHDNFRLQMFTTTGVFVGQFGERLTSASGSAQGWMPRPAGLAVDVEGRIYLTDALMGTVRLFDPIGIDLGKIVEYGYHPGDLRAPCDVALSQNGARLFVASYNSSSVEVYDTTLAESDGGAAHAETDVPARWRTPKAILDTRAPRNPAWEYIENDWNGPHIVEDRPDICWPCHGISGQPGNHGGTIEGQTVLCTSCHNTGGRALNIPINERDIADPYGTNPTAPDASGRSHAWGVSAVNDAANSIGPIPGGDMSQYLDNDDNMKCSTCHNQHNTNAGQPYLRVSNAGDAMCKECHAALDRGPADGGSHAVGFIYPEGDGEYPSHDELAPLAIKDDRIECMTCHAPHAADSGGANDGDGDGMLLRDVNDETLCQTCHTRHVIHGAQGDWQPACADCHDIHNPTNQNVRLIASEIDETPVTYAGDDGACTQQGDFVHSPCAPPTYDGICEVCHTQTEFHRNTATGDHAHHTDVRCTACHPHSTGFLSSTSNCADCHREPPDGTAYPNRSGSHAAHFTGPGGPQITECTTCHADPDDPSHMDGAASFASGFDTDLDGNISLAEADVCDACHSQRGPIDGVNDPVVGAKTNWTDGVYDGDTLKPDKFDWCVGCHGLEGAVIHGVTAPAVAGDNATWGYNVAGHGLGHVVCTECHDPTLPHTDGIARTFTRRFPLAPGGIPKSPEERETDRESYNDGFRLRRVGGQRAIDVPRDTDFYDAADFRQCIQCHDEAKLLGVPENYVTGPAMPPPYLQLPAGVAQTNYRNEYEWGNGWEGAPANIHWQHMSFGGAIWDIDHDGFTVESVVTCVTCHNPHGARDLDGGQTPALMVADLNISYGTYDDGEIDREYGYIGSDAFLFPGGDLNCMSCHPFSGAGDDPPNGYLNTRFYRERLDLTPEECQSSHDESRQEAGTSQALKLPPREPRVR